MAEVDSICLYQITEDELRCLEEGSPSSLYLNFSILFLSTAFSFLISLLTTEIPSNRIFIVFVIITAVGFVAGIILFCLWFKAYRSSSSVAAKIKERLKADIAPKIEENDSIKATEQ